MTCAVIQGWGDVIQVDNISHELHVKATVNDGGAVYRDYDSWAVIAPNDSAAQMRQKISDDLRAKAAAGVNMLYPFVIPANCIIWPDCTKT